MIGVFDSGFGGLTVHRALIEALPGRDFVYLGDNRNAPYGVRPPIDVLNLTCAALERLFAEGCTLAVGFLAQCGQFTLTCRGSAGHIGTSLSRLDSRSACFIYSRR